MPSRGSFKLNVDGSPKDGIIAGRGIIRDDNGDVVVLSRIFMGKVRIIWPNSWPLRRARASKGYGH